MKTAIGLVGILTVSLLAFAGCGKKGDSFRSSTGEVQVIDATQFRPAFATAPAEIKALVDKVMWSIQGSMYRDALAWLDKLANTPALTDQLKKKMAASAPKPSP